MSSAVQKVIGTVSFLWAGSIFGAGCAFLTQVILARELTPVDYGVFAAALATITLVAPLAGFGIQGLWFKLFGAEGCGAMSWLSASFRFIMMSTVLVLLSLAAWATWGPHDSSVQRLLYLLLPVVVGIVCAELVSGKLQLEERYGALALWQILPNFTRLFFVVLIFVASAQISIDNIAIVYSMVAIVVAILGFIQLRAMTQGRFALKGHLQTTTGSGEFASTVYVGVLDIVRGAWPFGLSGVFCLVYFQSDIILLKYLTGSEAAGIYNVAFTVMAAVYLLPTVIYQKFLLPKYHRWANHDRSRFLQVYRVGNGSMLVIGGVTTVIMLLVMPVLIPMFFGMAYQSSIGILALLAFCAPVRFLATSVGATIVTQEHMRRKVWYMGTVAFVNLSLNFLLIPLYAAKGAAIATLLSEVILLSLYLLAVRRHVFGPDAWRGWFVTLGGRNV